MVKKLHWENFSGIGTFFFFFVTKIVCSNTLRISLFLVAHFEKELLLEIYDLKRWTHQV